VKVVVIGADGQLGTDLCRKLDGFELVRLLETDIDVTSMISVRRAILPVHPDVVINTAAFHNVDECELEPDKAFAVNAIGARNVAVVCQEIGAKVVFVSSDHVFGASPRTVPYTEFDQTGPVNVYGRSKVAGELAVRHLCLKHFIVRSCGLFGVAGPRGKRGNFVDTMVRLGHERSEIRVVADQVTTVCYTLELAKKITQLIQTDLYGTFHIANHGVCSWFEYAREIIALSGSRAKVLPITTAEYPQKAARPAYSALDNYHLRLVGMDDMRPWREALKDYMVEKGYIKQS